jgi:hypothetical protein
MPNPLIVDGRPDALATGFALCRGPRALRIDIADHVAHPGFNTCFRRRVQRVQACQFGAAHLCATRGYAQQTVTLGQRRGNASDGTAFRQIAYKTAWLRLGRIVGRGEIEHRGAGLGVPDRIVIVRPELAHCSPVATSRAY